jgi:hypothetical protein
MFYYFIFVTLFASSLVVASQNTKQGKVMKGDLPFVACSVCERATEELHNAVEKLRSISGKKPLDELQIIEIIDGISNNKIEAGEWLRSIDIVESTIKDKNFLNLLEPGGSSKCKNECETITYSAHKLFQDDLDASDLSAILWKNTLPLKSLQVLR